MVMICFVLDLRSISPAILRELKQSLLQLANFYAISAPDDDRDRPHSKPLRDRIGLCYVFKDRISCADELKVAYSPTGNFSLRDFHHAVHNLPTDAFLPEFNSSGALCCGDMKLPSVLSEKVLYSWGGHDKDISRKVFLITSCLSGNLDSAAKKTLADAADKCVIVDFVLLEQKSSHLGDISENINDFRRQICDLENCSLRTYIPDAHVLCGLVKQYLQELKDDMEEQLQGSFVFKSNLFGSLNQISCNLRSSFNGIIDGFSPCQACRCHGIPLDDAVEKKVKGSSLCPITGSDLEAGDIMENSLKVGEQTVLFLPSFQCCMKLQRASSPIKFNIIKRTNLGSLCEGVIFGSSYIVTPSASHESDDMDKPDINIQLFQAICTSLRSLDQGLVCFSNCNIETGRETEFKSYYLLLPSDKGPMLLRRLAGSEEVLAAPDVSHLIVSTLDKEIEDSARASLLTIDASDYNPVMHERGFHQKLNILVKESLQLGAIPPKRKEVISEHSSTKQDLIEETGQAIPIAELVKETPILDLSTEEEWEQLIVSEVPKIYSPKCISTQKLDLSVLSQPEINKKLDERTTRILERLEVPKRLKTKLSSPILSSPLTTETSVVIKKPLIPFGSNHGADHQGMVASQPMKPSFQRLKRKQR